MGFSVQYYEDNEDTLEAYLDRLGKDCELTEDEALKKAAEELKANVVRSLNHYRRPLAIRYKGRPAMADDVKISIRREKSGLKVAKVQGGKRTGTLWHIVNDGNLHSHPLFFMDFALAQLDGNVDALWAKIDVHLKE